MAAARLLTSPAGHMPRMTCSRTRPLLGRGLRTQCLLGPSLGWSWFQGTGKAGAVQDLRGPAGLWSPRRFGPDHCKSRAAGPAGPGFHSATPQPVPARTGWYGEEQGKEDVRGEGSNMATRPPPSGSLGTPLPISAASWVRHRATETTPSSVTPAFIVIKFDQEGNVTSFEKKKTELCQELSLQARDLRFQHSSSLTARNHCIIIRMESLKAVVTPKCLLVLDFRGLGLERWLVRELTQQLATQQQSNSLPFEFRALEAILQHRVNVLQTRLNEVHPVILDTLESLVDPKLLSADRSKLHVLLQNSKSLSELETDIRVFKDSLLKILDEGETIELLCLSKRSHQGGEDCSLGMDHTEEMELLLENYYMQAEELSNETQELKGLIDDSESVIFINLDSHRNVMMRLNLQLTMGTFSLSLFGLMGVAFGMNLESSFEEDPRVFWLVTGFMFLGSGLIWRRLLSFLGRHLEPAVPPLISPVWKRNLKAADARTGTR